MIINGVTVYEDSGDNRSPVHSFATHNCQVTRHYLVRNAGESIKQQLARGILGYNTLQTNDTRKYIRRELPDYYFVYVGALWGSSIPSMAPAGKATDVDLFTRPSHDLTRVQAIYTPRLYGVVGDDDGDILAQEGPLAAGTPLAGSVALPDEGDALRRGWKYTRFIYRRIQATDETIKIPGGLFKWVDAVAGNRKTMDQHFPFHQAKCRVTYTWVSVPLAAIPFGAIRLAAGGVNSVSFDGFDTDTLLFTGYDLDPHTGPLGDRLVNINYHMSWTPGYDVINSEYTGWCGRLRNNGGVLRWQRISSDGDPATANQDSKRPFRRVNLASLFRPDQ